MESSSTSSASREEFIVRAVAVLSADPRIVGLAAAGSYAEGRMDEFSDLDLLVAVAPEAFAEVLADRQRLAAQLGPLLVAFTGEHVGEPRLLICLYGPPPLHVDLKFIAVADAAARVDEPVVLWERGTVLSDALRRGEARYPQPDAQWIEDRFWVWIHYAAAKVGRGELFEAHEFLSFLRMTVLSPLGLLRRGLRPAGVRRVEQLAPDLAAELQRAIVARDAAQQLRALSVAVELYRSLRDSGSQPLQRREAAEAVAVAYLEEMLARVGGQN
jgi:predicted nucleotidyltransferase